MLMSMPHPTMAYSSPSRAPPAAVGSPGLSSDSPEGRSPYQCVPRAGPGRSLTAEDEELAAALKLSMELCAGQLHEAGAAIPEERRALDILLDNPDAEFDVSLAPSGDGRASAASPGYPGLPGDESVRPPAPQALVLPVRREDSELSAIAAPVPLDTLTQVRNQAPCPLQLPAPKKLQMPNGTPRSPEPEDTARTSSTAAAAARMPDEAAIDRALSRLLFAHAKAGSWDAVKSSMHQATRPQAVVNLSNAEDNGLALVHYAARQGQLMAVYWLVMQYGADPTMEAFSCVTVEKILKARLLEAQEAPEEDSAVGHGAQALKEQALKDMLQWLLKYSATTADRGAGGAAALLGSWFYGNKYEYQYTLGETSDGCFTFRQLLSSGVQLHTVLSHCALGWQGTFENEGKAAGKIRLRYAGGSKQMKTNFLPADSDAWSKDTSAVHAGDKPAALAALEEERIKPKRAPVRVPPAELALPKYWKRQITEATKSFYVTQAVSAEAREKIQQLMTRTFKPVKTRDRRDNVIPKALRLMHALRVENSKLWQKFAEERCVVQKKKPRSKCTPIAAVSGDVLTSQAPSMLGAEVRDSINEVFLWHGTTPEGASAIAEQGFRISGPGSALSLYGNGVYLAECSSKSDEYSRCASEGVYAGLYCLVLCRAVVGETLHMTTGGKETFGLIREAMRSEKYDSVLGDRQASVGTYREFVVYDESKVYPEYLLLYTRE
eukprot:TRINITY_DN32676_c0_g1_i2.p1 TRINITY_DN32676_c0_g1~~TRINITY_DN32676_c0_g1_i2.p1  ORF type:complete len:736 (+),score=136.31 TRINITY_DN32676_c0_g1_i2:46-2208(+)